MSADDPRTLDPRFIAGVQMIERTGARSFRVGYSAPDEGEPVVWYAVASYGLNPSTGRPMPRGGRITHEASAALDPVRAVLRLCEQLIDGGTCAHCGRHTIFVADSDTAVLDELGCVYAWDPELSTYRRNCEGET